MTIWSRVFQRLLYALYRQRIPVLLILLISLSAGTYWLWLERSNLPNDAAAAGTAPVEVSVQDLQGQLNQQGILRGTLTLKEKNGNRRIAMAVGSTETLSILGARGSSQITRDQVPQAYDLMKDTISQLGGRIDRVIVNDVTPSEYLAVIVVSNNGETRIVKARPGDAIALALKAGAPIFVEDKVLDKAGTRGSG
ncbi:MAG TPA: bifunctional nuclease family protein [Chloroflexota bacterium]|nr:bifunctional nuclease family protein [Chloroflexota bacterium]